MPSKVQKKPSAKKPRVYKSYKVDENPKVKVKCVCCGKPYPRTLEFFNAHKYQPFGLRTMCKICRKKNYLKDYELNEDPTIMKRCTVCKHLYPAIWKYFNKSVHHKYGIRPQCRWCQRDRTISYRSKQADSSNKWYLTHKEEKAAYDRLRYINLKARKLEHSKKFSVMRKNQWYI